MSTVKDLLKRTFDLWVKKRWLKEISRSVDRYNKYKDSAAREQYILNSLIKEYNNIYHENLRGEKHGRTDP